MLALSKLGKESCGFRVRYVQDFFWLCTVTSESLLAACQQEQQEVTAHSQEIVIVTYPPYETTSLICFHKSLLYRLNKQDT